MASELQRFYSAKAKAGLDGNYGYDNDGNLVQRNNNGNVLKTITLPTYRRPTDEEYDIMEKTHREAIAIAEREVDNARSALYAMSQNPERDLSTMLRLNRAVIEADSKLVHIRFPLMYISNMEGIPIKQVDFTQPNNNRKVPYILYILETRPFTLQEQYVRVGENPEKPLVSIEEIKNRMKAAEKEPVIVFEGTESDDYGYLSLDWAIMIEFHSTMYHSAKQAIYAELAKFFNDEIHLPQLLSAKTADEIDYSLEDVPGENNADKWNEQLRRLIYEVNLAKFKQYPELGAKLLETKNAILGAYLPGDKIIGIGISIDNLDSKDPSKWGENVLGNTLMNIRKVLKTEIMPVAEDIPNDTVLKTPSSRKKSKSKPKVGTFAPTTSDISIPSIAISQDPPTLQAQPPTLQAHPPTLQAQPSELQAQPPTLQAQPSELQAQPSELQAQPPTLQGGVELHTTKRTLRMGGQRTNIPSSI